ncbi:MAG: hypothetical protein FD176_887 [Rhodospirillaceae bacterium]|nr:MAG: hypothetical protein FD176_887 [Rhodospirillaceae bacterium]TNC97848.1 MAG: hypothetical protein FD119_836 [Stygiobacter sp.]
MIRFSPSPATAALPGPPQAVPSAQAPSVGPPGTYHYAASPLPPRPSSRNGISTAENEAVRQLSGGRVNLHALNASVTQVAASDSRLAAVGARSYAQGRNALISAEADRGHELWHLAQQAMGQVRADTVIGDQPVNTHEGLEREADHMGSAIARASAE